MRQGFIKKMISNQYTLIDLLTKEEVIATARGKFRYMKLDEDSAFQTRQTKRIKKDIVITAVSPKVGDYVTYDETTHPIMITEIKERKNTLTRPDVSNVDQALLVFSAIRPDFSFKLLDKFLIVMRQANLDPVIVISKIDLVEPAFLEALKKDMAYYEDMGHEVYYVNSKQRVGIDVLTHIFKDKITVLAGQTGVGKSTLLNALMPELRLKTQEISEALGRGKHTTRHTELYSFNEGFIVDTPGFSKIEFTIFFVEDVKTYYPDFIKYQDDCKFKSKCLHLSEPGCSVKAKVKDHTILNSRYENYIAFCDEVKAQKDTY